MNWITLMIAAFMSSCVVTGDIKQETTAAAAPIAESTVITANNTELETNGSITGKIKYAKGWVRNQLSVIKDEKTCGGEPLIDESLLTSEEGGLQWTVVSIEGEVKGGKAFDCNEKVLLNQTGCTFQPHVLVVGKNCTLTITNNDPTLHNVRTVSFMNDAVNKLQMYIPNQPAASDDIVFEESEVVSVICDVHGWMKSFVHVVETPYNEVTDENGLFTMADVPPGKYSLKVWHEKLGELTQTVEVKAGQATEVEYIYK